MDFKEYHQLAMTTLNKDKVRTSTDYLLNAALGLTEEAGEFSGIIKKYLFQGHGIDKDVAIKELGDILWYLAEAAEGFNISLEEIAKRNISKLKKRYPNGFTVDDSLNRKVE